MLTPDYETVENFLCDVLDRDYFHLCRIDPSRKDASPIGKVSSSLDEIAAWACEYNAKGHNIYYQWNPPGNKVSKKAKRDHVKIINGFHTDLDLPKSENHAAQWFERARDSISRIKGVPGQPTIVMTGNGLQALWFFEKPIRATAENIRKTEDINARIAQHLGADSCHNIDRLLRLPGTVNWPDDRKKKLGRVPVMSELWDTSADSFAPEDFGHLAAPTRSSGSVGNEWRIDYVNLDYLASEDEFRPITWREVQDEDPFIVTHLAEMLDEHNDRSATAYGLLLDILRAMVHILDEAPEMWLEDRDIYKNCCEIFLEAVEDCEDAAEVWTHYDNQKDPFCKLGYDVRKALLSACDSDFNTPRSKRRAHDKQETASTLKEEPDSLTAHQHRREFVKYMRAVMENTDLPNLMETSNEVASARQNATESNVREVFFRSGIVARWDVMRDQPVYDVLERAGKPVRGDTPEMAEKRATAPRRHFHGALQHVAPDMMSAAQESLLMDALHERGIVARRDLSRMFEIVAKENRFHPIEDYCRAEAWDGMRRISQLADCLETDHPLRDTYLHIFFRQGVAAVKSLQRYKLDGGGQMLGSVPILVGKTGMGKTSFWRAITPPGFRSSGSKLELGGHREPDSLRKCLGGMVSILDEIGAGMDYAQAEAWTNFLTETNDEFRVAFAHWPIAKPRMTVFVGTSNDLQLKDPTGSRRFLVMQLRSINWDRANAMLEDARFLQQCYAEAWHDVMVTGEEWWLSPEQDAIRARENQRHETTTEDIAALEGYFNLVYDRRYRDVWLTTSQIFAGLGIKYSPAKARNAETYLREVEGIDYRDRYENEKGRILYRVWEFPATSEFELRATGS